MEHRLITLAHNNPADFTGCEYLDCGLPSSCYFLGPMILLQGVSVNRAEAVAEVPATMTIRESFERQGFRLMADRILGVKVQPSEAYPRPMEHAPGGYNHSDKIIVPDDITWGELFPWVRRLEESCQTEFWPIGAAPRKEMEDFLTEMLAQR